MLIKEYRGKASDGRNRLLVDLSCDVCGTVVTRQKRYMRSVQDKHFCSPQCKGILEGTRTTLRCAHCNKKFTRSKSDLSKSKHGVYFCCRKCKDEGQKYITEIQPEHYGIAEATYRAKAFKYYPHKCAKCGFDNKYALDVHHIDCNRENNNLKNLQILCCNCHAIEHRGS